MQPLKPYVIRERSLKGVLSGLPLPVFAVLWGVFVLRVVHGDTLFAVGGTGFIVAFWVKTIVRPSPVLEVGPKGFGLDGVVVPWPSLGQVVITLPEVETGPGQPVGVGLRLYPGAPLPSGMSSIVYDPRDPDAVHRHRSFRGGMIDMERLTASVAAFGRTEIVESRRRIA